MEDGMDASNRLDRHWRSIGGYAGPYPEQVTGPEYEASILRRYSTDGLRRNTLETPDERPDATITE
jgi:hypothetical protein